MTIRDRIPGESWQMRWYRHTGREIDPSTCQLTEPDRLHRV